MNKQKWMISIKVQKNIYKNYNLGRPQAALLFIFQFLLLIFFFNFAYFKNFVVYKNWKGHIGLLNTVNYMLTGHLGEKW
jgi:hypothetical protein